jgi:hypothetical protein
MGSTEVTEFTYYVPIGYSVLTIPFILPNSYIIKLLEGDCLNCTSSGLCAKCLKCKTGNKGVDGIISSNVMGNGDKDGISSFQKRRNIYLS